MGRGELPADPPRDKGEDPLPPDDGGKPDDPSPPRKPVDDEPGRVPAPIDVPTKRKEARADEFAKAVVETRWPGLYQPDVKADPSARDDPTPGKPDPDAPRAKPRDPFADPTKDGRDVLRARIQAMSAGVASVPMARLDPED